MLAEQSLLIRRCALFQPLQIAFQHFDQLLTWLVVGGAS
jgi:hypothetical protein